MKSLKKKIIEVKNLFVGLIIFSLLSPQLFAQENYKIGVVDVLKVLEQAPQAEAAMSSLKSEFSPRDKVLLDTQKEVKKLEEKLQRDRAVLSGSEVEKMERDVINRKRELKRDQDEFRDDVNFRRNEEIAKVRQYIATAIQDVAKKNNFDLVLTDGVMYATPKVNISDLVIDHLKKEYSSGAQKKQ